MKQTQLVDNGCNFWKEMTNELDSLQEQGHSTPTLKWVFNQLQEAKVSNAKLGILMDSKFWLRCLCPQPFSISKNLFFFAALNLMDLDKKAHPQGGLLCRVLNELQITKICCRTRLLAWTPEPFYSSDTPTRCITLSMLRNIPWKPLLYEDTKWTPTCTNLPLSLYLLFTFASLRNISCGSAYAYVGHFSLGTTATTLYEEQMRRFRPPCSLYRHNKTLTPDQLKHEEKEGLTMERFRGYALTFESKGQWFFLVWSTKDYIAYIFTFPTVPLTSNSTCLQDQVKKGGFFYHTTFSPFQSSRIMQSSLSMDCFCLFLYAHLFVSDIHTIPNLVTLMEQHKHAISSKYIQKHKEALGQTLHVRYQMLARDNGFSTGDTLHSSHPLDTLVPLFLEMTPLTSHSHFIKKTLSSFYQTFPPTHLFPLSAFSNVSS
jgi:hypothetical protein